jgi:hypothetical protein
MMQSGAVALQLFMITSCFKASAATICHFQCFAGVQQRGAVMTSALNTSPYAIKL